MNKYKEIFNPLDKIQQDIYDELIKYPINISQIIESCLNAEREINEGHQYFYNYSPDKYLSVIKPVYMSSTAFGTVWENEIRHRLNKLGIIKFIEGDHNSGEDCTCIDNPYWCIEVKTKNNNLAFNNTNDSNRTHKSTKYANNKDLEEHFYILVAHHIDINNDVIQTHAYKIFWGKLCKRDFKNPNGSGAAYLTEKIRNEKCIEIWNDKIGNTIEYYQSYLDNDYYEKMLEIETNEISIS